MVGRHVVATFGGAYCPHENAFTFSPQRSLRARCGGKPALTSLPKPVRETANRLVLVAWELPCRMAG